MKKYLYLLLFCFITPAFCQNIISKIYCQLLGNNDCKKEYIDLTRKALKDFGIQNPENVPVKKMNSVGSIVALMPVSSFTAFGIWFDEKYLDSCSSETRIFQIYHEAAHYALYHHQKILATATGISIGTIVGLIYLYKHINNNRKLPIILSASILSSVLIYLGILPNIVKKQEKHADIEAAEKLISLGRKDIIINHIKILRKFASSDKGNIWWFSDKEQIEYLEEVIK